MAKMYNSPGVGYTETEEFLSRSEVYSPIVVIIGGAVKGPTEITTLRSQKNVRKIFGTCSDNDFGVYAADYILGERCTVLYKRVLGKDAANGKAGTETDKFVFETQNFDSSLEGAIISLTFDSTAETVDYVLKKGTTVIESYKKLSVNKDDAKYLPVFLKNMKSPLVATENEDVTELTDVNLTIRGSNDGIDSIVAQDYIDALAEFSNFETIEFSAIIVPGVSDSEVIVAAGNMAKERGDCLYIPDIPFGTTSVTALEFVNATGDTGVVMDNEWMAVYGPWVQINDLTRGKNVWTPPSIVATRVLVQSDNISGGCWIAAAGFADGRGVVPNAIAVEYNLSKNDRDSWQGEGNVINPIAFFKGLGIAVFGNKTTKRTPAFQDESVYCSIHIRRLANYVKRQIINVSLTELFNPNDTLTWASWKAKLNPKLKVIKDGRGLEDYKIVMDENTVSAEDIRNGQAPGIIYIKPTRALEYIPVTFAVTENSVIFTNDSDEEVYVNE